MEVTPFASARHPSNPFPLLPSPPPHSRHTRSNSPVRSRSAAANRKHMEMTREMSGERPHLRSVRTMFADRESVACAPVWCVRERARCAKCACPEVEYSRAGCRSLAFCNAQKICTPKEESCVQQAGRTQDRKPKDHHRCRGPFSIGLLRFGKGDG